MAENLKIVSLLEDLKLKSKKIFEDEDVRETIKTGLQQQGYEGCDEDNPERIWKVLRRAVNSSVSAVTYVNLRDDETRLQQMLLTDKGKRLKDCLSKPFTHERASQLKSPKDMADKTILGITKDAPISFVTKLIEQQFSIQWNTRSVNGVREPDDFNFYTFCDVEMLSEARNGQDEQMKGKTRHLKYNPRRAHVMVQLYRFCREETRMEYSAEELCPPVYIQTASGWREWDPVEDTFTSVEDSHFHWMNEHIYQCISSHAIRIQKNDLENSLTKHTLYWAVVQDEDFQPGDHLRLQEIGKTQVYVGKAEKGIKGRWLKDDRSHGEMMKSCLHNVQAMITYDPSRLEGIQLVDARILLAKLREKNCALFVMETYEGTNASENLKADEKAHINGKLPRNGNKTVKLLKKCPDWKPKYMAYGMNGRC